MRDAFYLRQMLDARAVTLEKNIDHALQVYPFCFILKTFKIGPSKICGREPLKSLK